MSGESDPRPRVHATDDGTGDRLVVFRVPVTVAERCESGLIGVPGKHE